MPPPLTRVSRQLSIVVETGAPARSKGGGGIGRSGGGGLEAGLSPGGAPSWAELPGTR